MASPDYYRILGVAPYSEDVVIQAAYRALMRRYHPDANKSADAGKRATEINEAYAVLSDPKRRTRYDAERKAERAKAQGGQGSSPPPPPRSKSATQPPAPNIPPNSRRSAWIATGVIGSFLLISTLVANIGSGTSAADNNMAVENLMGENLVVENDLAPEMPTAPPTLATLSQTPVQYDDIESAAARFAQLLTKSGMSAARSVSERCHAGVVAEPNWSSADWCAAFDYAAAHVDAEVSKAGGWAPMPYFRFQAENQVDRYKESGAADYFVITRLTSIKAAAESAVNDAMLREIQKSQKAQETASEPSAPAATNESSMRAPTDVTPPTTEAANRIDSGD